MNNHHEVGHFWNRLMIVLLSLFVLVVTARQSFAATDCSSCHGMPPLDSAERSPTSGSFKGSHQIHVSGPAVAADCVSCHSAAAGYDMSHSASPRNVINITPGIYSKGSSFDQTPTPIMGNCTNASCHADVYSSGFVTSPDWGSPGSGCSTCHTISIGVNGPATGSHAKHAGLDCTACHAAGTTATTAPSKLNGHIDGNIDVYFFDYSANVTKHAPGTYAGTCSTAYCHSNGTGSFASPTWGNTSTGCRFCHPNLSAGHDPHLGTLFNSGTSVTFYNYTSTKSADGDYKFGCANCHPLLLANHLNNSVEVELTASASGGHLKALNGDGATYSSNQCSNVYCHSNGYKPGASFTFATTPAWGGSLPGDKCANCHGNSPNTAKPGSPAHTAHLVGIHYDNIYNGVTGKLPQGGDANINAAHGKDSRSTTINCNICHAVTMTTSANDENTLCAGCHNGTTAPLKNTVLSPTGLISNAAKHVNGSVDVVFIDQTIATKAQVANTAFAAYTANASGWIRNSNGMPYKTYTSSYDYTKSTLLAGATPYTTANGCLNIACHASIPVKWTDTVSCNSCHIRLR